MSPLARGDTVPIAYKSHLYSNAEQHFAPTEKILTAVQMAVINKRPRAQGKRIIVVTPVPALEAVTKASIPNAKALHPHWIQWATSLTATDVDYIFDPKLQTQEFLQDPKGNTIKHRTLWRRVADLKAKLPCVHETHTLGHQCVGVHVNGKTLADEAAKFAVAMASVAAVTHSQMRLDNGILTAVKASAEGKSLPKAYATKYYYHISAQNVAYATPPGVGD
ncbi:hypothetical protein NDU88_006230 [Pleurodeles waltl]|uniref:Reverse transcriptase RNase H-like domain-containing protein n=1 Tax=Pleurodeles waltl TaxID=8319 RepID=A0AAV7QK81_PLEWA|nr:hypothetical protein NDU88_006230 [Pleurodeles waltl]